MKERRWGRHGRRGLVTTHHHSVGKSNIFPLTVASFYFGLNGEPYTSYLALKCKCTFVSIATLCDLDPAHFSMNWSGRNLLHRLPFWMGTTPFKDSDIRRFKSLKMSQHSEAKHGLHCTLHNTEVLWLSSKPLNYISVSWLDLSMCWYWLGPKMCWSWHALVFALS